MRLPKKAKKDYGVLIKSIYSKWTIFISGRLYKLFIFYCEINNKNIFKNIADQIEARLDEFAIAESTDQGKPLFISRNVEIPRAIKNFRFFASAILNHKNESTESAQAKILNYTTETPAGVAILISPWNLPLYLLSWKIAPCIASG